MHVYCSVGGTLGQLRRVSKSRGWDQTLRPHAGKQLLHQRANSHLSFSERERGRERALLNLIVIEQRETYVVSEEDPVIVVVLHRVDPRVARENDHPFPWKVFKCEALEIELRVMVVLHYHGPWNSLRLLPLERQAEIRLTYRYRRRRRYPLLQVRRLPQLALSHIVCSYINKSTLMLVQNQQ